MLKRGAAISGVVAAVALMCVTVAAGSSKSERQAAYDAGIAAYVHGFPPLISRASQAIFPVNALIGVAGLSTPANKIVVLPNVDTVYTVSRLDLRSGPLIIGVPASPRRYYVFQFMDAYTNVFGYIGTRTTGTRGGSYAIVGPSHPGAVPGYRTIHSPTPDALLVGRTLVKPGESTSAISAVLASYTMTPLSALAGGGAPHHSVVITSGARGATPPLAGGTAFLGRFDDLLAADPPGAAERAVLAGLTRFGIGAGRAQRGGGAAGRRPRRADQRRQRRTRPRRRAREAAPDRSAARARGVGDPRRRRRAIRLGLEPARRDRARRIVGEYPRRGRVLHDRT